MRCVVKSCAPRQRDERLAVLAQHAMHFFDELFGPFEMLENLGAEDSSKRLVFEGKLVSFTQHHVGRRVAERIAQVRVGADVRSLPRLFDAVPVWLPPRNPDLERFRDRSNERLEPSHHGCDLQIEQNTKLMQHPRTRVRNSIVGARLKRLMHHVARWLIRGIAHRNSCAFPRVGSVRDQKVCARSIDDR